ncbi:protein of unknown function [Azospirillum baldaniorum]|uniref:Uncharacterized protein n=1 Tax=Azospirillum baldaniorum TaxID=1064539 RepID=A0A9P1NM35_9PROT|nr:protein of unknown function [Azospirillum baldaniorum]
MPFPEGATAIAPFESGHSGRPEP